MARAQPQQLFQVSPLMCSLHYSISRRVIFPSTLILIMLPRKWSSRYEDFHRFTVRTFHARSFPAYYRCSSTYSCTFVISRYCCVPYEHKTVDISIYQRTPYIKYDIYMRTYYPVPLGPRGKIHCAAVVRCNASGLRKLVYHPPNLHVLIYALVLTVKELPGILLLYETLPITPGN